MQTAQVMGFSSGPYWQLRLCKDGDPKLIMVALFSLPPPPPPAVWSVSVCVLFTQSYLALCNPIVLAGL